MNKGRLEAFSDGVLAIIITIMVLEIKPPATTNIQDIKELVSHLSMYLLSFIFVGIYWNNHHHMLHTVKRVTGGILWANLHLLFWLSLIPFVTAWIGNTGLVPTSCLAYVLVLLGAAIAYTVLQCLIVRSHHDQPLLREALGSDWKGKISVVCYLVALIASQFWIPLYLAMIILVAILWLVPDRRIESKLQSH